MNDFQLEKRKFTINNILDVVSNFYEVDIREIIGSSRSKDLVAVRWIVVYISRKYLNKSLPYIGRKLGNRDHTSIAYAYNKISNVIENNSDVKKEVDSIMFYLENDTGQKINKIKKADKIIFEKQKKVKLKKVLNIIRNIEDLPSHYLSSENITRQNNIIEKYQNGYTLQEMGEIYKLTRERINQIVRVGLQNKVREMVEKGFAIDFDEFLKIEKNKHTEALKNRRGIIEKEIIPARKPEFKWSRYYNFCKACRTTIVPHGAYGYCRKCYTKTEAFKEIQIASRQRNIDKIKAYVKEYSREYNKRPEVKERVRNNANIRAYSGNRERALIRDGYKCTKCGMTKDENFRNYGKDLNVVHINGNKDHNLDNLATMCTSCCHIFTTGLMWQNRNKKKLI